MEQRARRDVRLKERPPRRRTKNGDSLPKIGSVPGVLLANGVRCGKPTCRCAVGPGHGPYAFLHWREGAVQRRRYVRQAEVAAVREVIARRRHEDRAMRQTAALALAELRRMRGWLRELEADRRR